MICTKLSCVAQDFPERLASQYGWNYHSGVFFKRQQKGNRRLRKYLCRFDELVLARAVPPSMTTHATWITEVYIEQPLVLQIHLSWHYFHRRHIWSIHMVKPLLRSKKLG